VQNISKGSRDMQDARLPTSQLGRGGDMRVLTNILRLASVPVGVLIGLWTAQLQSFQPCAAYMRCSSAAVLVLQPTFAAWECALFGAGAAVVLVLVAEAVARLRPRTPTAG
jgi:hypothetical protein